MSSTQGLSVPSSSFLGQACGEMKDILMVLLTLLREAWLVVSNYNEKCFGAAYEQLRKRVIPLDSNQVNYSLICRLPVKNGVKAACDELGITAIAYSPITQGVLTGKYIPNNPLTCPHGKIYTPEFLTKLQPLINRIKAVGDKYGKTLTQVVLNWLICQENVVPIPGAKNGEQAREFAGALGWRGGSKTMKLTH